MMKQWNTLHKVATIIGGSMFGIATIAISVPSSNMGRMLRAEVESPPSLGFDMSQGEQSNQEEDSNEEAPPELDITIEGDDDPAVDPPCTDGELQNNDSEICEDGEFIECDSNSEGDTALDDEKTCEDDEWVDTEDDPAQPPEEDDDSDLIKITRHEADPDHFNPTIEDIQIEYAVDKDAILEIVINNISDQEILTLLDDEEVDEGEGEVDWTGTDDNKSTGTVLPAGLYKYEIKAKNTETEVVEDTEEGLITLEYAEVSQEEDTDGDPEVDTGGATEESTDNVEDNSEEVLVITNQETGETSATGPSVFIYSIFPLLGMYLARRKK